MQNTIFFQKKTIQITQNTNRYHTINHNMNITETFPKIYKDNDMPSKRIVMKIFFHLLESC